jgi:hypothetical protein
MRKARELAMTTPDAVAFIDFADQNFDQVTVLEPTRPTRTFWQRQLAVALDDLASLVAPSEIVICEGNPAGPVPGKNAEHDAVCYDLIFADEYPDVKFLSAGNASDVAKDRLGFLAALPKIAAGIAARRLIDRDDHAPPDVQPMASEFFRAETSSRTCSTTKFWKLYACKKGSMPTGPPWPPRSKRRLRAVSRGAMHLTS